MNAFEGGLREVVDELQVARERLLLSVGSLSQADLDFTPSADRWSIGEILHHLRLIEDGVLRVLEKLAARAEKTGLGPDPGSGSVMHSLDRFAIESTADRVAAPASVAPRKGIPARELLEGLAGSRAALLKALTLCARFDLAQVSFPHPVLGKLDGYQWALYVGKHEERHRRQIEKVKVLREGDPPARRTEMRGVLEETARRALTYLDGIGDRHVAPSQESIDRLRSLDEPLSDAPTEPREVIRLLDEAGSGATMAMAGPRFFGFVTGGSLPAALGANWLAAAWDQNSAFFSVTPGAATLERVALRWLVDMFGLPPATAGAFVTGATMANFTALAAARHAVLSRAGWNVEADGLIGAPPVTVIVGEEAHSTLFKSLGLLGLGRKQVVRVPVDSQGRLRAETLPRISGPTIICTQAGNVNTGAFDPIGEVCARVQGTGAWVHVDGAFGLWAAASPALRHLASGIGNADSWGTDAHKWLNVPYDSGLAFVRDAAPLYAAMAVTADYLPPAGPRRNPSDFTPELSRRARGVEVWAALKSLGRIGTAEMIERCCRHARRFAEGLRSAGHEVLNDVVLNQVLVAFGDPDSTNRVISGIQADGTCWCGGTVWQGRTAMRISVCGWSTTDADVEKSLQAMIRAAGRRR
ncbi:MAG: pyridoxal-dependent decarboxylase [Spirochaetia bacterium]